MSGGTKFLKIDAEKSPEERLENLERMIPVLIDRIQKYDIIINDSIKIKSTQSQQEGNLSDIKNYCDKLSSSFDSLKGMLFQNVSSMSASSSENASKISTLSQSHEEIKELLSYSLGELRSSVNSNRKSISEISNVSVKTTEFDQNKKEIEAKHYKISSDLTYHDAEIVKSRDLIGKNSDKLTLHAKRMDTLEQFFSDLRIEVKNIKKDQETFIMDIQGKISYVLNFTSDTISKKHNEVIESVKEFPSKNESLKRDLNKKMDDMQIDFQSANLKSNNITKQISIIERKIENIFAQLKAHEIASN